METQTETEDVEQVKSVSFNDKTSDEEWEECCLTAQANAVVKDNHYGNGVIIDSGAAVSLAPIERMITGSVK